MAELIQKEDTLNQGRVKLNNAILDAEKAKNDAATAKEKAETALANSESTQQQLDTIVIEGDSSVEAAQARVSSDGTTYSTLKQRLDTEYNELSSRLAQTQTQIGMVNVVVDFGAKGDGTTDDLQAFIQAKETGKAVYVPNGTYFLSDNYYLPKNFIGESYDGVKFVFATDKEMRIRGKQFEVSNFTVDRLFIEYMWESSLSHINVTEKFTLSGDTSEFGSFWNQFTLCTFRNTEVIGYAVNSNTFNSCKFRGGAEQPLLWGHTDRDYHGNNFIACDFSYGGGVAIRDDVGQGNNFIGCYLEGVSKTEPFKGFLGTWENGIMNDIPLNTMTEHFSKLTLAMVQTGPNKFGGYDRTQVTENLVINGDGRNGGVPSGAFTKMSNVNIIPITSIDDPDLPDKGFRITSSVSYRSIKFVLTPQQIEKAKKVGYVTLSFLGKKLAGKGDVYIKYNGGSESISGTLSSTMKYHSFTFSVGEGVTSMEIIIYLNTSETLAEIVMTDIVLGYGKYSPNYIHNEGTPLETIDSPPTFIGQEALVNGVWYKAIGTSSTADWKPITG